MDSYTHKQARHRGNIFTIYELCEMFDIPPYGDPEGNWDHSTLYEANIEYIEERAVDRAVWDLGYTQSRGTVYTECGDCFGDGEYFEDPEGEALICETCGGTGQVEIDLGALYETPEYEKARDEVERELYSGWKNAVEEAIEETFAAVRLNVTEVEVRMDGYTVEGYRLDPQYKTTWHNVAWEIIEIINGYGYFWFDTVKDLMDSIPVTTPRKAALDHIHWVKHRWEVYCHSGIKPDRIYQDALEHYLRYW